MKSWPIFIQDAMQFDQVTWTVHKQLYMTLSRGYRLRATDILDFYRFQHVILQRNQLRNTDHEITWIHRQ